MTDTISGPWACTCGKPIEAVTNTWLPDDGGHRYDRTDMMAFRSISSEDLACNGTHVWSYLYTDHGDPRRPIVSLWTTQEDTGTSQTCSYPGCDEQAAWTVSIPDTEEGHEDRAWLLSGCARHDRDQVAVSIMRAMAEDDAMTVTYGDDDDGPWHD